MIKTIIFGVLIIIITLFLIKVIINICSLFIFGHKSNSKLMKNTIILGISIIFCAGFIFYTQLTASTPSIVDEDGKVMEGSIAQLRQITLNGHKEWISIRGNNRNNPILLFLAGGPGGSQMSAVRYELKELEKYFVVVNWDQPGSGKSYNATRTNTISVDTYIEDGHALTEYLCHTFNKEKIYIVGESWGSALGIFLINNDPDLYHAFIGTGQMVDFLETEKMDYEMALQIAKEKEDTKKIEKLESNGYPPYYGKDVTWKSAEYLNYLSSYMGRNPEIKNGGYNTFRDLFSSEYGLIDKVNYFRGIINTFNHVYPNLYDIDLRNNYKNIEVPVYFFLGRHDINAPTSLVEDYYNVLNAPKKQIVWFQNSGHSPWINESSAFVDEVVKVLREN